MKTTYKAKLCNKLPEDKSTTTQDTSRRAPEAITTHRPVGQKGGGSPCPEFGCLAMHLGPDCKGTASIREWLISGFRWKKWWVLVLWWSHLQRIHREIRAEKQLPKGPWFHISDSKNIKNWTLRPVVPQKEVPISWAELFLGMDYAYPFSGQGLNTSHFAPSPCYMYPTFAGPVFDPSSAHKINNKLPEAHLFMIFQHVSSSLIIFHHVSSSFIALPMF